MIGALVRRVERGGGERAQDVIGAPGEFAGNGQSHAGVREPARRERVIVAIVGAALMGRALRGLEQRPAQGCRALPGQLAELGVAV